MHPCIVLYCVQSTKYKKSKLCFQFDTTQHRIKVCVQVFPFLLSIVLENQFERSNNNSKTIVIYTTDTPNKMYTTSLQSKHFISSYSIHPLFISTIIVFVLLAEAQLTASTTVGADVSNIPNLTPFLINFMNTATFMDLERVNGDQGWTDTWSKNRAGVTARPFVVELSPTSNMMWNQTEWNCQKVVQEYGNRYILYQHLGDGTATGETTEMWDGVALSDATKTMKFCLGIEGLKSLTSNVTATRQDTKDEDNEDGSTDDNGNDNGNDSDTNQKTSNTPVDIPVYFNTRSDRNTAKSLHFDLDKADLRKKTPVYVEANTADPIGRQMLDSLLKDGTLRVPPLPDDLSTTNVQSFMYIGGLFSGTYMHQHGSACLYSDGPKLWFLLNKTGMCKLRGPPSIPRHLPQRCPARSDECIENIHPLEILQHYEELHELGIAPFLHLQRAGEVFCFPERWFHGTVNLGPTVAPAFVLDRVDTPWYTSNYCEDLQDDKEEAMSIEEDADDIDQELTDEELKMWISASGDSDLADAVGLEGVQGFSGNEKVGYSYYMNEGIAALVTHRIHESIEYFNQAIEVAEAESDDLWKAHMTLARAYADSLTSEEFLCHEVANTTSAQHDLLTKAMFNANIAIKGLKNDAELSMILADVYVAVGNISDALPLVTNAVEIWFDTYNKIEYPNYLDDPMWIVGTVSMAISVARRIGETDLASQWFWKAKELSGMFKWKYPTQIPGNIDWFPQPALKGNIEVPGWLDIPSLEANPASSWFQELKSMKLVVMDEMERLLAMYPPSKWEPLRSHRPDYCGEPLGSKEIRIWRRGNWNDAVCEHMPKTCTFLRQHAAIVGTNRGGGLVSQVSVMLVAPGLHRGPSFDNTGERMVAHFGVDTAMSSGGVLTVRAANATRRIKNGVLAYDSSFENEIWNEGNKPWIGLHIPFFHPRYAQFLDLVPERYEDPDAERGGDLGRPSPEDVDPNSIVPEFMKQHTNSRDHANSLRPDGATPHSDDGLYDEVHVTPGYDNPEDDGNGSDEDGPEFFGGGQDNPDSLYPGDPGFDMLLQDPGFDSEERARADRYKPEDIYDLDAGGSGTQPPPGMRFATREEAVQAQMRDEGHL